VTQRVKVCGITRIEDALLAADLGAAALGFVFWPGSPRFVEPARAREIAVALPRTVVCVGVFVDQDAAYVRTTSAAVGLGAVQLHGHESVEFAAALMEPVIKAVPVREGFQPETLDALPSSITVLLDAHDPDRRGGTGKVIDWDLARQAAGRRPVILAGGLTPDNVGAAVAAVDPYAVDVSSGVESAPGVKDAARLRQFFAAVTEAGNR
jgi:phosphoribosylanthranilate isomerase